MDEKECNKLGGNWVAGMCQYGKKVELPKIPKIKTAPQQILLILIIFVVLALIYNLSNFFSLILAPLVTVLGVIFLIVYFVSPVDIIPDIIPGFGWLDDIIIAAITIGIIIVAWTINTKWIIFFILLALGLQLFLKLKRS